MGFLDNAGLSLMWSRCKSLFATKSELERAIPFVQGTQTAATSAWTGAAPFSELEDGQQITYWLPYAGSGNATLNLTLSDGSATGAVNCYYGGTTRLTTHYPAGSSIPMVYRSNAVISGTARGAGWWAKADYNSDNTYNEYYYAYVLAKTALTAGRLIVGKSDGWNMIAAGMTFDVSYPILWIGQSVAAGDKTSCNTYTGYVNAPLTYYGTWSGIWGKPVYLKGTLSGPTFTIAQYPFLTQDVPSSDDGYVYIRLGLCSYTGNSTNTSYLRLETSHPMYRYSNGAFKSFEQIAEDALEASRYAPTSSGSAGQYLVSSGSGSPVWATLSGNNTIMPNGYPAGSVCISHDPDFNPAAEFGGTWTARDDTFLFLGLTVWKCVVSSSRYLAPLDMYPVGVCYLAYGDTNPAYEFGGTWTTVSETHMFMGITIYKRVA